MDPVILACATNNNNYSCCLPMFVCLILVQYCGLSSLSKALKGITAKCTESCHQTGYFIIHQNIISYLKLGGDSRENLVLTQDDVKSRLITMIPFHYLRGDPIETYLILIYQYNLQYLQNILIDYLVAINLN